MNCKIHPVLYKYYLSYYKLMGARLVHSRKRSSEMCIEVIFLRDDKFIVTGQLNSLKEAEECGFLVICRPQNSRKHMFYKGHRVYQIYLSPVHPKKRRGTVMAVFKRAEIVPTAMIA